MNTRKSVRENRESDSDFPHENKQDNGVFSDYRRRMAENLAWYERSFTQTRLATADERTVRFAWHRHEASRAVVIIVNGRTEFSEKYIEVLRDLHGASLSLAIYDHAGQGDSGRLLDDPQKGHIDHFSRYEDDLGVVVEASREQFGPLPLHLLCHSMGGTIGTLWCASNPGRIDSLLLCAPMFAIETGGVFPAFVVESVARMCCRNGMAERYVATTGPFDADLGYDDNMLTGDRDRFGYNMFLANNLAFAPIGGPTYRWLCEAFTAMKNARNMAPRIDCPIRFFAGSDDRVVGLETMRQVAEAVNGDFREFEQGRHELLMETDSIRDQVLAEIRAAVGWRSGSVL